MHDQMAPLDDDDDGGPWGVYENHCVRCGRKILVVATVHSVENGYCEKFGEEVCQSCAALDAMVMN